MKQVKLTLSFKDEEYKELEKISEMSRLSIPKVIEMRLLGLQITRIGSQKQADVDENDYTDIREKWYAKNQQHILEAWKKSEINWRNLFSKNPDLGFDNPRELKSWITSKIGKLGKDQTADETGGGGAPPQ